MNKRRAKLVLFITFFLFLPTVYVYWPSGFVSPAAFLLMAPWNPTHWLFLVVHGLVFTVIAYVLASLLVRVLRNWIGVWIISLLLAGGGAIPVWGIVHEAGQLRTLYGLYYVLLVTPRP